MQTFRFRHEILGADDPRLAAAIAATHGSKLRPLCTCQPAGVPMYVARSGDRYIVKRMPNSGSQHHLDCDSYEPPAELRPGSGELASRPTHRCPPTQATSRQLDRAHAACRPAHLTRRSNTRASHLDQDPT